MSDPYTFGYEHAELIRNIMFRPKGRQSDRIIVDDVEPRPMNRYAQEESTPDHAPIWIIHPEPQSQVRTYSQIARLSRRHGFDLILASRDITDVEANTMAPAFHELGTLERQLHEDHRCGPGLTKLIRAADHPDIYSCDTDTRTWFFLLPEPIALNLSAAIKQIRSTKRITTYPGHPSLFRAAHRDKDVTLQPFEPSLIEEGLHLTASPSKKMGFFCVRLTGQPIKSRKTLKIRASGSFNYGLLEPFYVQAHALINEYTSRRVNHHRLRHIQAKSTNPSFEKHRSVFPDIDWRLHPVAVHRDKTTSFSRWLWTGHKTGYRTPLNNDRDIVSERVICALLQIHFALEYHDLYEPRRRASPKHELRKLLIEPVRELRCVMRSSIPQEQHALLFIRVLHTIARRVGVSGLEPLSAERYPPCPSNPLSPRTAPRSCPRPPWRLTRTSSRPRIT